MHESCYKQKISELEARLAQLQSRNDNASERLKELNCMYKVAECAVLGTDATQVLEKIVNIIPSGWRYPEITVCRIYAQGFCAYSTGFQTSEYGISESILIEGEEIGSVDVFVHIAPTTDSRTPFLPEEKKLLTGMANIISFFIKEQREKENKQLIQQQLLHADRLANIGILAAGVAHELNEPLGNILGFAQLAQKDLGDRDRIQKDLQKIEEASLYSREIIRKLMDFSRQTPPKMRSIDFTQSIEFGMTFLEARCRKEGILLQKKFSTKGAMIWADPNQIKQVLTNLVINAIQAMPAGGKISISTAQTEKNVSLFIEDTGHGISHENMSKIFMPFFTTKEVGQGTGLGLSVVYGIIKSHNGDIKVSSTLNVGSCFEIIFPKNEKINRGDKSNEIENESKI